MNPIDIVNTALCVIILIMGYWGYTQKKQKAPLLIGIAFAFFGVSHIVTMIGLGPTLLNLLITIRVIAYLLVVIALWLFMAKDS